MWCALIGLYPHLVPTGKDDGVDGVVHANPTHLPACLTLQWNGGGTDRAGFNENFSHLVG